MDPTTPEIGELVPAIDTLNMVPLVPNTIRTAIPTTIDIP